MENDNPIKFRKERHDRFWTGLILLIVGGFLLADRMGVYFPDWLFDWPSLLILIGIVSGIKCGFRNLTWLILIAVGGVFLFERITGDRDIQQFVWPMLIIFFGLIFIFRPKKKWRREKNAWDYQAWNTGKTEPDVKDDYTQPASDTSNASADDVIDSISIFGGVKKVITSKTFKGGEIICFMGGAEYNLSQADFTGRIEIEVMQAFGGTKFVVPPHWEIRSESVAIFAGIEDKRPPQPGAFDPKKLLVIKGTTIFGGIEIRSY